MVALRRKKGVVASRQKKERERERKRIVYRDRARAVLAGCLSVCLSTRRNFRTVLGNGRMLSKRTLHMRTDEDLRCHNPNHSQANPKMTRGTKCVRVRGCG